MPEEAHSVQRSEQHDEHPAYPNRHVADRKLNFVPQLGDVALSRDTFEQRFLHRVGMSRA